MASVVAAAETAADGRRRCCSALAASVISGLILLFSVFGFVVWSAMRASPDLPPASYVTVQFDQPCITAQVLLRVVRYTNQLDIDVKPESAAELDKGDGTGPDSATCGKQVPLNKNLRSSVKFQATYASCERVVLSNKDETCDQLGPVTSAGVKHLMASVDVGPFSSSEGMSRTFTFQDAHFFETQGKRSAFQLPQLVLYTVSAGPFTGGPNIDPLFSPAKNSTAILTAGTLRPLDRPETVVPALQDGFHLEWRSNKVVGPAVGWFVNTRQEERNANILFFGGIFLSLAAAAAVERTFKWYDRRYSD